MPEKIEKICQYLEGGHYCNFNQQASDGQPVIPSGTHEPFWDPHYWDEDIKEYRLKFEKPRKALPPPPGLRVCFIALPLNTINQIGKAQKDCTGFVSVDARDEQLVPLPVRIIDLRSKKEYKFW